MNKKVPSKEKIQKPILEDLRDFIDRSPTAWHAVANLKRRLLEHHFTELSPGESWVLEPGGKYLTACNGSTLAAFILPKSAPTSACILGTHTDSPALKLKPHCEYTQDGMVMFGVEVYGSPLLNSWLNRDLGLAGRIFYIDKRNHLQETLVQIDDSPFVIPQLAIHLDREINEKGLLLNKENHLSVLACVAAKPIPGGYLEKLLCKQASFEKLIGHDLFLYPLTPTHYVGPEQQMLAGYRLDNLCSVHAALTAITTGQNSNPKQIKAALFWDNEETGSQSAQGSESPFLPHLLERILFALHMNRESYLRLLSQSLCVSIDLAHAIHPNYPEKHQKQHSPILNNGITLKFNSQQRYATSGQTGAHISHFCHKLELPLQKFSMRNDMPCGTTIGPITAALTGIPTVDIGIPQLSMHSCRELIGCQDHVDMCKLLGAL
jgi:aspartyl aminopeptidase